MHISLLEKLLANQLRLDVYSANGDDLWKYAPGDQPGKEEMAKGSGRKPFRLTGPMPADGTIPDQYSAAFTFATGVMRSITNMPVAQKALSRYVVMFVETDDTIWVEFAPLLATGEAPHLGCQTKLGRDMVFGFAKNETNVEGEGPFLQCF